MGSFIGRLDDRLRSASHTTAANLREVVSALASEAGLHDVTDKASQAALLSWTSDLADGLFAVPSPANTSTNRAPDRVRLLRAEIVHRSLSGEKLSGAELARALRAQPILPTVDLPKTPAPETPEKPKDSLKLRDPEEARASLKAITGSIEELRGLLREQSLTDEHRRPPQSEAAPKGFFPWSKQPAIVRSTPREQWRDRLTPAAKQALIASRVFIDVIELDDAIRLLESFSYRNGYPCSLLREQG